MADALSTTSRDFFERTKAKLASSLALASISLMLLGFGAYAGGQAQAYNTLSAEYEKNGDDTNSNAAYQQGAGYGFATFVYITGCILLFIAAVHISPLCMGSANEGKLISTGPHEINTGYSAYSESAAPKNSEV